MPVSTSWTQHWANISEERMNFDLFSTLFFDISVMRTKGKEVLLKFCRLSICIRVVFQSKLSFYIYDLCPKLMFPSLLMI